MELVYNSLSGEYLKVEAGFLVVKTFARQYRDHRREFPPCLDIYALPRADREPEECPIQYRGLDRDALDDYKDSDMDAELQLALLAFEDRAVDGMIWSRQDAEEVFSLLGPLQTDYEIIWSRVDGSDAPPPNGYVSVGFEPTYFVGDHFSASSDCMFFPRWHGTDEEGVLFIPYFSQLNRHGLFRTAGAARDFLGYYLSFDWTEHNGDDYVIAEVFIRQQ